MALRWAINCASWSPSGKEFEFHLSVLPLDDQKAVIRYMKFEDQKRALLSRLFQRMAVHSVLKIPYEQITISRTPEGKPYLKAQSSSKRVPNFNFNVAHHGSFVVLASEPVCLVGVDIMAHDPLIKEPPMDYIENFRSQFSDFEWKNITRCKTETEALSQFYRHWCMKEAYVKAVGIGLGFELKRLEFFFQTNNEFGVRIDGKYDSSWRFFSHELQDQHWVCVARGPPSGAVESLRNATMDGESYQKALQAFETPFEVITLEDVLPSCKKDEFLKLKDTDRA